MIVISFRFELQNAWLQNLSLFCCFFSHSNKVSSFNFSKAVKTLKKNVRMGCGKELLLLRGTEAQSSLKCYWAWQGESFLTHLAGETTRWMAIPGQWQGCRNGSPYPLAPSSIWENTESHSWDFTHLMRIVHTSRGDSSIKVCVSTLLSQHKSLDPTYEKTERMLVTFMSK